jgi:hypothetical protein
LNEIQIPSIAISGIGKTTMVGSGSITGLPDTDKAYFDFDIKNLCQRQDVNDFLPKETIPNSINLPASFNAKGTFKGTINNFSTDLILESSFGPCKMKALFDQRIKIKKNIMSKQNSTILIWENSSK